MILSLDDFALYLCILMVSLMIFSILEHFFPGEDFVPEEDFVLCIFSPLLFTFSCGIDYILQDFVPGGFCPGKRFCPLHITVACTPSVLLAILDEFK